MTQKHYNLDAIISVGYRVNSTRGTQFRIWATQRLREYIVKGFVMDDERLKTRIYLLIILKNYHAEFLIFELQKKRFYRKITDIYATSVDYDPKAKESILFSNSAKIKFILQLPETQLQK